MLTFIADQFVFFGVTAIVLLIGARLFISKVREGEAVVIERMGKFHKVLKAGLHVTIPILDSHKSVNWSSLQVVNGKVQRKQLQTTHLPFKKEIVFDPRPVECMTKGGASVVVDVAVRCTIVDVEKCVYGVEDLFHSLQILLETSLFRSVQECDVATIMGGREAVKMEITERLNTHTQKWGVNVIGVDIQNVSIPQELQAAILRKITSEQENSASLMAEEGRKRLEISKLESQTAIDKKHHENNMAKIAWERKEQTEKAAMEIEIERLKARGKDDVMKILFGEDIEARNNYVLEEMRAGLLLSNAPKAVRTVFIPHDVKMTTSQPFVSVN